MHVVREAYWVFTQERRGGKLDPFVQIFSSVRITAQLDCAGNSSFQKFATAIYNAVVFGLLICKDAKNTT
jgi:hypothetical protein